MTPFFPAVGGTTHTYHDNGNLAFDGRFHYYYDCENRLRDVNDAGNARVASYAYDYRGRRISRTIYGTPNVTIRYAYDGDRIIAEYDGAGTLLRKFVYGPGLDEPICLIDVANGNAAYYYHLDGLGSVVALSDVNNVLVERYAYDVFGRPTIRDPNGVVLAASAWGNPYLFTGRAYDAESGLYYYRARYYDYATGRFLQPDPLGYADGINWYLYCANNPVLFIDPWGFCRGVGAASTAYKALEAIGDIAGILYALKEVSDVFEVKAGLALGAQLKVNVGPLKGEVGFSLTGDALKVEQSRTTLVTGVSAGATGQVGPYSFGPSVNFEMDRMSGKAEMSLTPIGVGHTSGAQAEPYKLSIGGTVAIFTGEVGINLTEVLDLINKVAPAITGNGHYGSGSGNMFLSTPKL